MILYHKILGRFTFLLIWFCSAVAVNAQTFQERYELGENHVLNFNISEGIEVLGNLYNDLKNRKDIPEIYKIKVAISYARILELGDQDESALRLLTNIEEGHGAESVNQESILIHITLSRINEKSGYATEAYENLQNAYSLIKISKNDSLRARYYKRMASLIRVNDASDSIALCYLDSAEVYAEQFNDLHELGEVNLVRGLIAKSNGDYEKSEKYSNAALVNWAEIDDEVGKAAILTNLAYVEIAKGNPEKALEFVDSIENNYHPDDYLWGGQQMEYVSIMAYEMLGMKDSIISSYSQLIRATREDEMNKMSIAITELKVESREDEIENELKISEQNVGFERALNFRLFIIMSIILLGALILIYFFRRVRKNKKLIEEQRRLLEQALKDNETLFEEVHHRVKNNISIISSMMQIQIREENNEALKEKLRENELRIRSIGLVHTLIFNYDRIQRLLIDQYFNELIKGIVETYGTDLDVEFDIQSDEVKAGLNIMVPIGLLMNELVTNSVKHAKAENLVISVKTTLSNGILEIAYGDNGKGFDAKSSGDKDSFGISMIKRMVRQIEGELTFSSPGTHRVTIRIPFSKTV